MPSQTLLELIDAAKRKTGSLGAIADGLGIHQSAISAWKKEKHNPSASQIAYLADCAGWPVLETVAKVESELETRFASVWTGALGKLKAAGVAASMVIAVTLASSFIEPVHATTIQADGGAGLYIMLTILAAWLAQDVAVVNRLRGWVQRATVQPMFSQC